ncbi:MAG: type III-B CRISPR module-associated Cmr3 family protein [Bacillota bacterium]
MGRDPLLFGDGRPFANELGALAARTLREPMPETIAGFVRTVTGSLKGWKWNEQNAIRARSISVHSPIILRNGRPMFRAPSDALITRRRHEEPPGVFALRPFKPHADAGIYLDTPLDPLLIPDQAKPEVGYNWWPMETFSAWLASPDGRHVSVPDREPGMPIERRAHVAIDDQKGSSLEKHLYTTEGIVFTGRTKRQGGSSSHSDEATEYLEWSILAKVSGDDSTELSGVAPLGGEGRLASIATVGEEFWPKPSPELVKTIGRADRVRMILVTPAHFNGGWKPEWLDDDLQGTPPSVQGLKLRLVSAAVGRRMTTSGWDLFHDRPKLVRWLVGSGSVYFFEVVQGSAAVLTGDAWLKPVSDEEQSRRDGYGLAVWGVW